MTHTHSWSPLPGWIGRYRCLDCRVIAHRMTTDGQARALAGGPPVEAFRPYLCTRKDCTSGAVQRKPRQLCAVHAREMR